jgi:PAS domain S-box-containing protein
VRRRVPKGLGSVLSEKFLDFFESVPDAMVLSDQKGEILGVNANTELMFGYSRDELIGKEVEILVPERFRTLHRKHRSVYYADPRVRRMGVGRELFACGKNGVEFPIEISLSTIDIRGKPFVWSAIRNISDRDRFIAELQAAMHQMHLALEGLICMCAWCKRVRDEGASWQTLQSYVRSHSQLRFSHGICQDCLRKLDPAAYKPGCGVAPPSPASVGQAAVTGVKIRLGGE